MSLISKIDTFTEDHPDSVIATLLGDWKDSTWWQKALDIVIADSMLGENSFYNSLPYRPFNDPVSIAHLVFHEAVHYAAAELQNMHHSAIQLFYAGVGLYGEVLHLIMPRVFELCDNLYGYTGFVAYSGTPKEMLTATAAPLAAEIVMGNLLIQGSRCIPNRYVRKAVAALGIYIATNPLLTLREFDNPYAPDIRKVGEYILALMDKPPEDLNIVPVAIGLAAVSIAAYYGIKAAFNVVNSLCGSAQSSSGTDLGNPHPGL